MQTLPGPAAGGGQPSVELVQITGGQTSDVLRSYRVDPDPLCPPPRLQERLRRPSACLLVAEVLVEKVGKSAALALMTAAVDLGHQLGLLRFDNLRVPLGARPPRRCADGARHLPYLPVAGSRRPVDAVIS